MKRAMFLWIVLFNAASGDAGDVLLGFRVGESEKQRELEERLVSDISANDLREWIEALAAKPHHVGSTHGKQNAEYIAKLFKQWGYHTQLATYDVLIPVPKVRVLEMLHPTYFQAILT